MRTAVIADIHANLEALTAVLERIRALKIEEIVCLGDIVGYNANPNETIQILRQEKVECILGNHDAAAGGTTEPDNFNPLAKKAVVWTRGRLTEENKQFLRALPREKQVRGFFLFHGSIHDTDRYILYRDDAVYNFRELARLPGPTSLGFFGHTHVRTILGEYQGVISTSLSDDEILLLPGKHYLINPGSVGQPRDGDPRAAFLVYDEKEHSIIFHRVLYDIRSCQDKILLAGLPPRLAERLEWGR